jgi:hypothetical protein
MSPILGIWASAQQPALNAGSYESIATVSVGVGGSSSISFTSIPQTYTHLQLRLIGRTTRVATTAGVGVRLNGSTAGQNYYANHGLTGNGSAAGVDASANRDNMVFGVAAGSTATSGMFGAFVMDLLDYANTNKNKTIRTLGGVDENGSGTVSLYSGLYTYTTAITSITLKDNDDTSLWAQYSHAALYGIK